MKRVLRWIPVVFLLTTAILLVYLEATTVDRTCEEAEFNCYLPEEQGGYGGSEFVLKDCWDGGLHWYCTCDCLDAYHIPIWSGICTFS
jgi:hypothetical protein